MGRSPFSGSKLKLLQVCEDIVLSQSRMVGVRLGPKEPLAYSVSITHVRDLQVHQSDTKGTHAMSNTERVEKHRAFY
jgi:hypothetical protein